MTNARDLFFSLKGCWISKKNPSELCDGMQHWKHYYPKSERSSSNQNQTYQNSGKKMPESGWRVHTVSELYKIKSNQHILSGATSILDKGDVLIRLGAVYRHNDWQQPPVGWSYLVPKNQKRMEVTKRATVLKTGLEDLQIQGCRHNFWSGVVTASLWF